MDNGGLVVDSSMAALQLSRCSGTSPCSGDAAGTPTRAKNKFKKKAIEKELIEAKKAYNKACEDSNRPHLVFDEKTPEDRPVGLGS